jgi:hypothetical protein
MESRAECFRSKSLECLKSAQTATDRLAKVSFLQLAESWRELAEQIDQLERPKS